MRGDKEKGEGIDYQSDRENEQSGMHSDNEGGEGEYGIKELQVWH